MTARINTFVTLLLFDLRSIEFREYRLPHKNMQVNGKTITSKVHCKPPPSPYISQSGGFFRLSKSTKTSPKDENKMKPSLNKSIESKIVQSEEEDSFETEKDDTELNDFEYLDSTLEGEMYLLDNLDSELSNDNFNKLADLEKVRSGFLN